MICAVNFFFSVMVDVVTGFAVDGALGEMLCAYGMVLVSETIEGLRSEYMR